MTWTSSSLQVEVVKPGVSLSFFPSSFGHKCKFDLLTGCLGRSSWLSLLHVLCKALCIYNSRLIYDLKCNHCMFFVTLCWVSANTCYLSRKLLCLYRYSELEKTQVLCFLLLCFFWTECVLLIGCERCLISRGCGLIKYKSEIWIWRKQ